MGSRRTGSNKIPIGGYSPDSRPWEVVLPRNSRGKRKECEQLRDDYERDDRRADAWRQDDDRVGHRHNTREADNWRREYDDGIRNQQNTRRADPWRREHDDVERDQQYSRRADPWRSDYDRGHNQLDTRGAGTRRLEYDSGRNQLNTTWAETRRSDYDRGQDKQNIRRAGPWSPPHDRGRNQQDTRGADTRRPEYNERQNQPNTRRAGPWSPPHDRGHNQQDTWRADTLRPHHDRARAIDNRNDENPRPQSLQFVSRREHREALNMHAQLLKEQYYQSQARISKNHIGKDESQRDSVEYMNNNTRVENHKRPYSFYGPNRFDLTPFKSMNTFQNESPCAPPKPPTAEEFRTIKPDAGTPIKMTPTQRKRKNPIESEQDSRKKAKVLQTHLQKAQFPRNSTLDDMAVPAAHVEIPGLSLIKQTVAPSTPLPKLVARGVKLGSESVTSDQNTIPQPSLKTLIQTISSLQTQLNASFLPNPETPIRSISSSQAHHNENLPVNKNLANVTQSSAQTDASPIALLRTKMVSIISKNATREEKLRELREYKGMMDGAFQSNLALLGEGVPDKSGDMERDEKENRSDKEGSEQNDGGVQEKNIEEDENADKEGVEQNDEQNGHQNDEQNKSGDVEVDEKGDKKIGEQDNEQSKNGVMDGDEKGDNSDKEGSEQNDDRGKEENRDGEDKNGEGGKRESTADSGYYGDTERAPEKGCLGQEQEESEKGVEGGECKESVEGGEIQKDAKDAEGGEREKSASEEDTDSERVEKIVNMDRFVLDVVVIGRSGY
ncbi:hypothetical protein GLAREA_03219 [Glarea lozoyensis ATCC 20868]|uniref:Uncharacterized protein n=1 Tax=Glarea lozoyensis (strain ATCC 20868 / MF5171) TaxID=1116229 RepID=S3CQC7_GLAL2|nr:uncharacterized protein GLAREA_03219 [Glarea lozoyensis ATCC 20868]EPE27304.1 hypothetical protein GLAREA_03219 [Glarea lozoyensis ATCC 20868]